MYPDILNYDKLIELWVISKAPMGCRSFLPSWKDAEGHLKIMDAVTLASLH